MLRSALAPAQGVPDAFTDDELIRSLRRGDDLAFERLYRRYHARIAAYVHGMVGDHARAEDVTQEVFISALRRMRATSQPIAFRPWIYEIARNACIDHFRRSKRAPEISLHSEGGIEEADHDGRVSTQAGPDQLVDARQRFENLRWAFAALSQPHHDILVMRELEGRSYREIGERLELTRAGVESTLFRARRRLASEFDELSTGRRCLEVQDGIESGPSDSLGVRETRRVAGHLAHCLTCRRQARASGREDLLAAARLAGAEHAGAADKRAGRFTRLREKGAAGLWPWPGLLTRWTGIEAAGSVHGVESVIVGWTRIAATVVAVGAIGVGAGMGTHITRGWTAGARATAGHVGSPSTGASGGSRRLWGASEQLVSRASLAAAQGQTAPGWYGAAGSAAGLDTHGSDTAGVGGDRRDPASRGPAGDRGAAGSSTAQAGASSAAGPGIPSVAVPDASVPSASGSVGDATGAPSTNPDDVKRPSFSVPAAPSASMPSTPLAPSTPSSSPPPAPSTSTPSTPSIPSAPASPSAPSTPSASSASALSIGG
jgi:RNA polymerase sigma factor (sigma-70 family)